MYPSFIIIGSTKCASSSLHNYLGQHPEIYTSKVKETGFFSLHYERGPDYYTSYFKEGVNKKIIGESTPTYCFLPYVAPRIRNLLPEAKLIICLRNPLDRAFSSWLMKTGLGTETLPFDISMDICIKKLDYTKKMLAGKDGEKYWIENNNNHSAKDELRPRTYIIGGLYSEMIKHYLQFFPAEQLKIIFFDELTKDLNGQLSEIFGFLGADPGFIVPDKESVNFYFDRKITKSVVNLLGQKAGRAVMDFIPKTLKDRIKKRMKRIDPPKLSMTDRVKYWECFKEDVTELEKMLGKDLSHWNPTAKSSSRQ